jgi:hypothetical protein
MSSTSSPPAPLCVNCVHCRTNDIIPGCHRTVKVPNDDEQVLICELERNSTHIYACGPEGRYFVPFRPNVPSARRRHAGRL